MKGALQENWNGAKTFLVHGYNIASHGVIEAIPVRDDQEIEVNNLENRFPLEMMMISEVEIEKETREEIITLFWYLIDLEQETIYLNSILLTQVFDIGDIGLEIIQVCDVFQSILFKNLLISFLEKALELNN